MTFVAGAEGLSRGAEELSEEEEEECPAGDRRGGLDVHIDLALRALDVHRDPVRVFCKIARALSERAEWNFCNKRNASELCSL